jgi:hypothetical protein
VDNSERTGEKHPDQPSDQVFLFPQGAQFTVIKVPL